MDIFYAAVLSGLGTLWALEAWAAWQRNRLIRQARETLDLELDFLA